MCALTVAPPISSPDSPNHSSWILRAARKRSVPDGDARTVSLCFRDLRVSEDDLTTVGEAFARCSAEEMLHAVMGHEVGWRIPVEAMGSRARHNLASRIGKALDAMRSLHDEAVSLSSRPEGVVGPLFRFAAGQGGTGLRYEVSAAALPFSDAAGVRELLASGMERVCTWDELRSLRRDAPSSSASNALAPPALDASASILSSMSWERVLALPLWLPSDLSEDERWAVLAKVFWSMTYRAFDQPGSWGAEGVSGSLDGWERRSRIEPEVLPADPLIAVLGHNCWVDTLEVWNALFGMMGSRETRL